MGLNKCLEKYGIINRFETELNIDKETFINEINRITEKGSYSPVLALFDIFISSDKEYVGKVNGNSLRIRKRFVLQFLHFTNTAGIKAQYNSNNKVLEIKTKIIGMEIVPIIMLGFIFIIYSLLMLIALLEILLMVISSEFEYIDSSMIVGPIILTILAFLITFLPYRNNKNNVKKMTKEIQVLYEQIEKTPYNNGSSPISGTVR